MSDQVAMCELRERKQLSFEAVCCDFAINHNMEALAKQIGIKSGTILRNKLNPEQPHVLSAVDMALLCKAANDYTILNTLVGDAGVVIAQIPTSDGSKTTVERVLENNILAGEMSKKALELAQQPRAPRSKKRKTIAIAQGAIANLVLLVSELEHRNTALQPLMQIGSDVLGSGMSLPGL
ncbi:phage regulatory CII family protein [uncultured Vibrio sp.]|uniref:phage regulatory CII family protein n=1 Tax=uncultured Vibrio sp. TaxID=114054 RepID=UPI0025F2E2BB|nr:phage regulatory CII family protein [uncultured Vibrio sp.]